MPEGMTGVLVFCPTYQQNMKSPTASTLYAIAQLLTSAGLKNQLLSFSASDIVDSRNIITTLWFDSYPQYSHMLMVDSDMHFEPLLVRDMMRFNKPLVGAIYSRREYPIAMVGIPLDDGSLPIEGGFVKMKYVGGGCTLISRLVIASILGKFPEANDITEVGRLKTLGITRILRVFDKMKSLEGQPLSEDYSLCERWRQCGGDVWASVEHRVRHIGDHTFEVTGKDLLFPKTELAA